MFGLRKENKRAKRQEICHKTPIRCEGAGIRKRAGKYALNM